MTRSASDATLFTSTTPHATSDADLRKKSSGPPGETPQEKVRRLRAAADRARAAQMSTFDRWVARGRVWADVAHTVTTTALIAATIIAGGVTIYALTDMIIYNRRKKAQYFAEQKAKLDLAIDTARQAIRDGTATEQQINFIKIEDEHQAAAAANVRKKGLLSKSQEWLFSGLKVEEEKIANQSQEASQDSMLAQVTSAGTRGDIASQTKHAFADEKERKEAEKLLNKEISTPANEEGTKSTSSGWMSWIKRW